MIRLSAFLFIAISLAQASTYTIHLDNSTTLDDGTLFTNGTTYYSAFQLTGGNASSSMATISDIELGGGAPISSSSNDPTSGTYLVAPNPASPDGIFQPSGTLTQTIIPANGYSLYTQQFVAGSEFQFTVSLTGTYGGGTPDSFSFQLYDASLDTPLYEQDLEVLDGPSSQAVTTSEPTSVVLCLLGVLPMLAKTLPILMRGERKATILPHILLERAAGVMVRLGQSCFRLKSIPCPAWTAGGKS